MKLFHKSNVTSLPPLPPLSPQRFDVTRPRRQYVSRGRFSTTIFHQGFLWSIVTYPDSRSAAYRRNFADRARFTTRRKLTTRNPPPPPSPSLSFLFNNRCPSLLPRVLVYTFTFVSHFTAHFTIRRRLSDNARSSFKPIHGLTERGWIERGSRSSQSKREKD